MFFVKASDPRRKRHRGARPPMSLPRAATSNWLAAGSYAMPTWPNPSSVGSVLFRIGRGPRRPRRRACRRRSISARRSCAASLRPTGSTPRRSDPVPGLYAMRCSRWSVGSGVPCTIPADPIGRPVGANARYHSPPYGAQASLVVSVYPATMVVPSGATATSANARFAKTPVEPHAMPSAASVAASPAVAFGFTPETHTPTRPLTPCDHATRNCCRTDTTRARSDRSVHSPRRP